MQVLQCDKCNKDMVDWIEMQEAYQIRLQGGYGSIFGDGNLYSVDLCQHCLWKILESANLLDDKFFTDPYAWLDDEND